MLSVLVVSCLGLRRFIMLAHSHMYYVHSQTAQPSSFGFASAQMVFWLVLAIAHLIYTTHTFRGNVQVFAIYELDLFCRRARRPRPMPTTAQTVVYYIDSRRRSTILLHLRRPSRTGANPTIHTVPRLRPTIHPNYYIFAYSYSYTYIIHGLCYDREPRTEIPMLQSTPPKPLNADQSNASP